MLNTRQPQSFHHEGEDRLRPAGHTSADAPNPDVTGAHDAFHRTLLNVSDTNVAAAHDRQACRGGGTADVDVAAALHGSRE